MLAKIDSGNITIEGKPRVGGTAPTTVRGAPAPFIAQFIKAGEASEDGTHELVWIGAIGCIARFEHGFHIIPDGPEKTTVTHYEKFVGGILGCLPAETARGIVADGYGEFERDLKAVCEKYPFSMLGR